MILRSVDIETFAGLSSLQIDLADGLNLIVGANEAGKSTIFRAIRTVMFEPAKQNKRTFERNIAPFLPVGGGDTIASAICMEFENEEYRLERRWGKDFQTRFILPSGAVISDDEEVQLRISRMLPASIATVQQVFLAEQSDLAASVKRTRESGEVFSGLSDSLRRSILESGGISITAFRNSLETAYASAFDRWDRRNQMPEQGRGIDNPWKSKVGTVLDAWYQRESIRRRIDDIRNGEDEIRHRVDRLGDLEREYASAIAFVTKNKPVSEAATRRAVLESNIANTASSLSRIRAAFDRWPVLSRELEKLEKQIAGLEAELPKLIERRDAAKSALAMGETRKRLARIDELLADKKTLVNSVALTKPLTSADVEKMRRIIAERDRCTNALRSGRLTLTVTSDRPTELSLFRGAMKGDDSSSDGKEGIHLERGETRTERIDGALRIVHDGLDIVLQAGDIDPGELEMRIAELTEQRDNGFAELGIKNMSDAEVAQHGYERARTQLDSLEQRIVRELGEDAYEDITARISDTPESDDDFEEIATKLAEAQSTVRESKERFRRAHEEMVSLQSTYQDRETLFGQMTARASELEAASSEIKTLPEIPDGFSTPGEFESLFGSTQKRIEEIREEKHRLALETVELRSRLPDESSEELERELTTVVHLFETELLRGEAVSRVLDRTTKILETPDNDLFGSVESRFSALLEQTTGSKYSGPEGWKSIPDSIRRTDGEEMQFSYLSAGTKDVFSICLRIALAEHYLENTSGFFILDDPLVDLDPERQRAVAALIAGRPDRLQRLLFTCHPAHVELFGDAHRVDIA